MYFCRGSLPWQSLKGEVWQCIPDRIASSKMFTTESLCRDFPKEFAVYLKYTRLLGFDERPDYCYLRKLFHDLFVREGYNNDLVFDWSIVRDYHNV